MNAEIFKKKEREMRPVSDGIKKRIIFQGKNLNREVIDDDGNVITLDYSFWAEGKKDAFDSTHHRKGSEKVYPRTMTFVPGIQQAIKSMKMGEMAEFIISPEKAYGPLGCPPR